MENNPFEEPIIVADTRVLRPWEYKLFKRAIPKNEYRTVFDALLFSGMRYKEFQKFQENATWFSENEQKIYLPKIAVRKKKIKRKQRWIRLSDYGTQQVSSFMNSSTKCPGRRTWLENLNRWAEKAGIGNDGVNIKMTRKTLECWLLEFFGNDNQNIIQILLSQGHTERTAINHYMSLPFSKQDRDEMTFMMEGWI